MRFSRLPKSNSANPGQACCPAIAQFSVRPPCLTGRPPEHRAGVEGGELGGVPEVSRRRPATRLTDQRRKDTGHRGTPRQPAGRLSLTGLTSPYKNFVSVVRQISALPAGLLALPRTPDAARLFPNASISTQNRSPPSAQPLWVRSRSPQGRPDRSPQRIAPDKPFVCPQTKESGLPPNSAGEDKCSPHP